MFVARLFAVLVFKACVWFIFVFVLNDLVSKLQRFVMQI